MLDIGPSGVTVEKGIELLLDRPGQARAVETYAQEGGLTSPPSSSAQQGEMPDRLEIYIERYRNIPPYILTALALTSLKGDFTGTGGLTSRRAGARLCVTLKRRPLIAARV